MAADPVALSVSPVQGIGCKGEVVVNGLYLAQLPVPDLGKIVCGVAILLGGQIVQDLERHQGLQKFRCDLIVQIAFHFHLAVRAVVFPPGRKLVAKLRYDKAGHFLAICFLHQVAGSLGAVPVHQHCRFGLGYQIPHPQQLRQPAGGHVALGQVQALAQLQGILQIVLNGSVGLGKTLHQDYGLVDRPVLIVAGGFSGIGILLLKGCFDGLILRLRQR